MGILERIEAYLDAKRAFEEAEGLFKAAKKKFYGYVEDYTAQTGPKKFEVPTAAHDGRYVLTRVQRVKITWDPVKTEECLKNYDKTLCDEVIKKELVLADKRGFIEYAKSLGAEPKKMLSFFIKNLTVDEKTLNRLTEVGELDADKLAGCYDIRADDPYWRVVLKTGKEAGEEKEI